MLPSRSPASSRGCSLAITNYSLQFPATNKHCTKRLFGLLAARISTLQLGTVQHVWREGVGPGGKYSCKLQKIHLAGFMRTFKYGQQLFFRPKISKIAIIKTKSATIAFFLLSFLPRSFFFSFPLRALAFSCIVSENINRRSRWL